ncbi:Uncharacterized protein Adt_03913 [Abeliophyllum distichum]|uniref:Transposase (putative) gypsy type domain-containing protein n=1 Tax=Abeliophyllum distichum TaxID=126358 RepID=A0ABD1W0B3_9LAMI
MSTGAEEGIIRHSGEGASPPISPSMEGVLPIRGVDVGTGEAVAIPAASLREAEDPYRVDVVRWAALDVPSIMVAEDMSLLRDAYKVPYDIELLLSDPNERACFPRRGCTALSLNAFVSGMRLPLHLFFRRILREYGLAPTQVSPNGWVRWLEDYTCGFAIHSEWRCLCTCSRPCTSRGSCRGRRARMRSLGGITSALGDPTSL